MHHQTNLFLGHVNRVSFGATTSPIIGGLLGTVASKLVPSEAWDQPLRKAVRQLSSAGRRAPGGESRGGEMGCSVQTPVYHTLDSPGNL